MTGQDGDVVAERKQFRLDSAKEQLAVTAGKIPATNAASKKNIAADQNFAFAREETKTAGRMPRHFENLEFCAEKLAAWRRFDKKIWLGRLDLQREAVAAKEFRIANHRLRFGMTADLTTEALLDLRDLRHVVEMAMRQ